MKLLHMCVHFQQQFVVRMKVTQPQYLYHRPILHNVHLIKYAVYLHHKSIIHCVHLTVIIIPTWN